MTDQIEVLVKIIPPDYSQSNQALLDLIWLLCKVSFWVWLFIGTLKAIIPALIKYHKKEGREGF